MPAGVWKVDLRSKRTEKALNDALSELLHKHNFRKITVSDICDKSLISRATFYVHFPDKYAFLKWWVATVWIDDLVNRDDVYKVKEEKINQFVGNNKTIIKNIFNDADGWTLNVIYDTLYSILHLNADETMDGQPNPKHIVKSDFCIGGMVYYILWQVNNDFPPNVAFMNTHVFEAIRMLQERN